MKIKEIRVYLEIENSDKQVLVKFDINDFNFEAIEEIMGMVESKIETKEYYEGPY